MPVVLTAVMKHAVEPAVAALRRPVALFVVEDHHVIVVRRALVD